MSVSKQELIKQLEELIEAGDFRQLRSEIRGIKAGYKQCERERRQAFFESLKNAPEEEVKKDEAGKVVEGEQPKERPQLPEDPQDERFNELMDTYRTLESEYEKRIAEEHLQKMERKKQAIAQLEPLIDEIKSGLPVGSAFERFRPIENEWRSVGRVNDPEDKNLQLDYNHLVDRFYHNIEIAKGLREMDHERNLESKQALLVHLKELQSIENIRKLEGEMRKCHEEWKKVGPVPQNVSEEVNMQYKQISDEIYDRIHAHYDERREEMRENLIAKIGLCDRIKEINESEHEKHAQWQEQTKTMLAIQEEWRSIGFSEENEKIWQVFRGLTDTFFESKREFYRKIDQKREENKVQKIALCEQAEALQHDTNWRSTTDKLIKIQKDWKNVGAARRGDENKLWERFRKACDAFFEAKKAHFASIHEVEEANLKLKEQLIERINAFEASGNGDEDFAALKAFSEEWADIGHVPFQKKDDIYKEYSKALDAKYDLLKLNREDRFKARYQGRIQNIAKTTGNSDQVFDRERQNLRNRIERLQEEIVQYENNMSFFSKGNKKGGDNPLLQMAQTKLKDLKGQLSDLRKQLNMLADAAQKAKETPQPDDETTEETVVEQSETETTKPKAESGKEEGQSESIPAEDASENQEEEDAASSSPTPEVEEELKTEAPEAVVDLDETAASDEEEE